jgi:hypothetical protein
MQLRKLYFLPALMLGLMDSCKTNEKDPLVDQRDNHVGTYVCDVTVQLYQTSTVLRSFVDTLVITKSGMNEIKLVSNEKQLPDLKFVQPNGYYGLHTIVRIDQDKLFLTNGPDTAFYEYKGRKIK